MDPLPPPKHVRRPGDDGAHPPHIGDPTLDKAALFSPRHTTRIAAAGDPLRLDADRYHDAPPVTYGGFTDRYATRTPHGVHRLCGCVGIDAPREALATDTTSQGGTNDH